MQCTLPPTLARFIPPLREGINKSADVAACRLPRGVPLSQPIFLSGSPGRATLCKPHKHNDVFPLRRTKLPSLNFNLVGRRLHSAKHAANILLPSGRALVYCCLPRRLITHERTTSAISSRKISKRAALSEPTPPLQFDHPPSPGTPLNCIQCVRLHSSKGIEGGLGNSW